MAEMANASSSTSYNQAESTDRYDNLLLAKDDILLERKEGMKDLLAALTTAPIYKLVYNENMLMGFDEDGLKSSYAVLWSDYMKAEQDPKVKTYELNLRFLDLVLRAKVLYQYYAEYLNRHLSNLNKKNIHSWLYDDIALGKLIIRDDLGPIFRGEKTCASKKSIMKSLPLTNETRLRILDFITKFGVEMILFTEFVDFSKISTISFSNYRTLCDVLNANMTVVNEHKTSFNLQEVFKMDIPPPVQKGIIISKK